MLKSTTVNENWFTPFANGRCQSLSQSTRIGLHPLLMVDVKSTRNINDVFNPLLREGLSAAIVRMC